MSIRRTAKLIILLGSVLMLATAAGCAGTAKTAGGARTLSGDESDQLLSAQFMQRRAALAEENKDLPLDAPSLELQGDNLAINGDFDGALFLYNRAMVVADKKQRSRLMGKAGELTLRQGRFAETRGIMEKLTRDEPTNAKAWQSLGLALLSLDERELAKKALGKAVAFNPRLWKAQNALGIIYNHDKRPHKALSSFNKAISAGPSLAELYNNRALAHLLLRDLERAEADWRRALAIKPDFKLAHNNLAILLAKKGDFRAAYRAFTKGSGQAEAHNNLGVVLAWRGQYAKAAQEFDQAMKRLPLYYPKASNHLNQVAALGRGLQGPMVVDLTEDGLLVPAHWGGRAFESSSRSKAVRVFKNSARPKRIDLSQGMKGNSKKSHRAGRSLRSVKKEKTKKEVTSPEPVFSKKPESKPEATRTPQVKSSLPGKVAPKEPPTRPQPLDLSRFIGPADRPASSPKEAGLDLSRFQAPERVPGLSFSQGSPVVSLLRGAMRAEPASAEAAMLEPQAKQVVYAVAKKALAKNGRTVWRGKISDSMRPLE